MSHRIVHRLRARGEEGFTLLELSVAMLIAAIALVALAAALTGGLRTVAIQKARTSGNEIATQGIEDLQRYDYDHLGVCATATTADPAPTPPSPPAGFSTAAPLANCSAPAYYEPCNSGAVTNPVPSAYYTCTRRGVDYTVRRYIAYGDAGQTTKRMAVVVKWVDAVGKHEVSQQSSLRSPTQASVIGVSPPYVTTATVSPATTQLDASGHPTSSVSLQATTSGVGGSDSLVAHFKSLDPTNGVPIDSSLTMTTVDGVTWTGLINASDYTFGRGSQFFYFNVVRSGDGKGNSRVATPANKFCAPPDTTCSSATLPSFTGSPTVPSTGSIDPAGILLADVQVSAVTKNVTLADRVTMTFQTQAGAYSISLLPNTATCTTSSCTWQGSISKDAGYRFNAGSQTFYFTAAQVVGPDPVDIGSTAAVASATQVNFQ